MKVLAVLLLAVCAVSAATVEHVVKVPTPYVGPGPYVAPYVAPTPYVAPYVAPFVAPHHVGVVPHHVGVVPHHVGVVPHHVPVAPVVAKVVDGKPVVTAGHFPVHPYYAVPVVAKPEKVE